MTIETLTIDGTTLSHETKMTDNGESIHIYSDGNYKLTMAQDGFHSLSKIDYFSMNPEIFLPSVFDAKKTPSIQTTSYGSLDSEEIDKMIEGYRIAQRAIRWISNLV